MLIGSSTEIATGTKFIDQLEMASFFLALQERNIVKRVTNFNLRKM